MSGCEAVATDGDDIVEEDVGGEAGRAEDGPDLWKEIGGDRSVAGGYVESSGEGSGRWKSEALTVEESAEVSASRGASAGPRAGGP